MVAARLTRAEQAAFGERQAHRLHNAVERGQEDGNGVGGPSQTSQRPPASTRRAGGFVAFPQGYIAPQARAGSDPEPRK